ncbi:MAG: CRISPR-associated helicase Cas3', partial [Jatrophihabitantaceae bacterium]
DATTLARTMPRPGLLIIEAPMGEGKTEAALLAAEVFAARSGAGGCFIALPTQATSNAMLDRLLRWLDNLPDRNGAAERSVALAHGKAGLNETYGELVSRGYFRNVGDDAVKRQGKPDAIVHRWLTGRKKRNLAFFVVGTIDQLLFGALKSRHVALRHLAMVGKVVILDEVHAYDVYMSRYLDRVLEWLGAYEVPTILLSATLPADRRADMVTAYQTGARAMTGRRRTRRELAAPLTNDHLRADIGYPVLIATSGTDDAGVHPVAPSSRQVQIQLSRMSDDLDELANTLRTELAEGGCAVVIRNTVGRVQEAARYLADNLAEVTIIVAHSRYLAIERAAIERRLLALFGPTGSAQRQQHRYVVIASQVVEQSLDLDFDLMVTDLAPVDLMLQRIGRLHRHERGTGQAGRAPRLRSARCLVTGVDWSTEPPNPVDGSRRVYQRYPLYRSLAALTAQLNDGQPVSLPADIGPLVQRAYDDAPLGPASWQSAMAAAAVTFKASEQRRRASAETFRLGPVGAPGNSLVDWLHAGVGEAADDPVDERVGSAQVRDGTGSLEVIVIQQDVDGQYTTPHWLGRDGGRRIPTNEQIDRRLARTVASCTLPLPPAMCVPKVIDQVITELELTQFPGWQETYSLVGQLVLVLDQQRRATVAGFTLSYDPLYGLEHHRD